MTLARSRSSSPSPLTVSVGGRTNSERFSNHVIDPMSKSGLQGSLMGGNTLSLPRSGSAVVVGVLTLVPHVDENHPVLRLALTRRYMTELIIGQRRPLRTL
jgi:hypothetical protein